MPPPGAQLINARVEAILGTVEGDPSEPFLERGAGRCQAAGDRGVADARSSCLGGCGSTSGVGGSRGSAQPGL